MLYVACPIYYGNNVSRISNFIKHIENIKNFQDFDDLYFVFFAEPNSEPIIDIIQNSFLKNYYIFKNPFQYNIPLNYYSTFHYCFENLKLESIFFLEDDVICSQDSPNLIKWCTKNNLLNDNILCLLNKHHLFNKTHSLYENGKNDDLLMLKNITYLSAWGCGIGIGFWDKYLKPTWSMVDGFDCVLTNLFKELPILSPTLNRLNHIGRTGTHYTEELYMSHGFDGITIYDCPYKIEKYNLINLT
jgi:hypothetical protein